MGGSSAPQTPSDLELAASRGRAADRRRVLRKRLFSWKIWSRVVYGAAGVVGGILFLLALGYLKVYRLGFAEGALKTFLSTTPLQGFWLTLEVVGVILPVGFGLGFLIGWARTTRFVVLRGLGSVYVDFFRSMPPIALIFFFALITALELRSSATINPYEKEQLIMWMGVVALAFHTAAYQAEIVRAGILSVPAGQTEAADALGLSRGRIMFLITLPQAFRLSLPALGNEFSSSIKDTSLLNVIGWMELGGVSLALVSNSITYAHYLAGSLVVWFEAAFLYFVVTYIATRTVRGIEDLYKVPGLEVAR
ncbi:MAG: amino acid ABC transporter permease [Thermoplasmata archaeon]